MANMSYCRFSNTLYDLTDCFEALGEICSLDEIDNYEERRAAWMLIRLCKTLASDCEEWGEYENRPVAPTPPLTAEEKK